MRRFETIGIHIERPYASVYRFTATPLNYPRWAAVDEGTFVATGDGDWAGETAMGYRHFRFAPVNAHGVLDHAMFVPGETPMMMPMRVHPNGAGTDLYFVFHQRPGMDDAQFVSAVAWITNDLLTLKALLEAL